MKHSYRAVLVLALSVIFAFNNAAFINAVQPDSGTASPQSATKAISAKALADHECNTFEWHFIINGLANEDQAPPTITVNFSNGNTVEVRHNKVNPNTAHYTTTTNLNSTVTSATAVIDASWAGNFNLSHGPCKPTPPPPPSLILKKVVINDNGGTMKPKDWTLSATAGGVQVLSGTTPVTSGSDFQPGTYTLAESGPGGYTALSWECTGTGTHSGSTITLAAGQSKVCTITNDDNPPALTLSAPTVVTPTPVTSATLTPVVIQSTPTQTPVQAQVVPPPTSGNVVTIPSTAQVPARGVLLPPTSGNVVPVPAQAQVPAPGVLPPTSGNVVTVTKLPSTSTADEQSSTGAIGLAALVLGQVLLMLAVRRWRHQ